MEDSLLVALRVDCLELVNEKKTVRVLDGEETTGTIMGVTKAFLIMTNEAISNRVERIRLDHIRTIDDPDPDAEEDRVPCKTRRQ